MSILQYFFDIDLDYDNRIRHVFWTDTRSRATWDIFGDVLCFNTIYLTNKYDMPFAPFFDINHHGKSILLGCGLLSSEDTMHSSGHFKVGFVVCHIDLWCELILWLIIFMVTLYLDLILYN